MTVYYIRMPLNVAKMELVRGLVKAYGLEVHQVLEIISDDPKLVSILSDLAEPPAVTEETLIPEPEEQPAATSNNGKTCPVCGKPATRRSGYCSSKCYSKAWREKKKPETTAAPGPVSTTADPKPAVLFGHNADHIPARHGPVKGHKLG